MSLKLFTFANNYRAWKVLVSAEYCGVNIVVPPFEMGKDNKTPEFLALNPLGKIPVLETPEGSIYESNAIARHIARLRPEFNLYGSSFFEHSLIDQWVDFVANEIEPAAQIWTYPILGYMKYDKRASEGAQADIHKALEIINNHLLLRTYLVGNRMTLADIILSCALVDLYKMVLDPSIQKKYINVTRWFTLIINQPCFINVVGKFEFCQKVQSVDFSKTNEGKKDKKGKKEKGKKEEKPKEEKKEAAPKPKKEKVLSPDEQFLARPAKVDVDTAKRIFSNNSPADAFKEFWELYEPTEWKWFKGLYNYNQDNEVLFMTCNLMGGMIQRADGARKYGLGIVNCCGESEEKGPYDISTVWLFKSNHMPDAFIKDCPDAEYYTYTELHPESSEDDKKEIEMLFFSEEVYGKKLQERKWFK